MTITPPRGTTGSTTRTARNRGRRRQTGAGEPRHAADLQSELAPSRRRNGGRHAAAEPSPTGAPGLAESIGPTESPGFAESSGLTDHEWPAGAPGLAGAVRLAEQEWPAGTAGFGEQENLTGTSGSADAAGIGDVAFPVPTWDPWATHAGQDLPFAGITDPFEASGVIDSRAFHPATKEHGDTAFHFRPVESGDADLRFAPEGVDAEHAGRLPHSMDGWAGPATHDTGIWNAPAAHGTDVRDSHPALHAEAGEVLAAESIGTFDKPAGDDVGGGPVRGVDGLWTEAEPAAAGCDAGTPSGPDDEPVGQEASVAKAGRRTAYKRRRSDRDQREEQRRRGGRRPHARRLPSAYLSAAGVRCALYLGPLSVAVAAAEPLGRVAWPVPAVMLLLGWTAAQGLTSVGVSVARRGGPAVAARLVGAGFAAVVGLWCALVWIAPDALLGPDRALALTVGVGGLLTLGSVTAALVTRAEGAVAGWQVPCWLLAAAVMAEAGGVGEAALVPVETLLPAVIVAAAIRAFRPALLPAELTGTAGRAPRLTAADRRRGVAYLVIGAAQAVCVALLWRAGPAVMPLPAALPLVLAVPLLEGLIGWHTARLDAGLDSAETRAELDRHVRNVTAITLAGLLPPLAAGCGLLAAAYRLPYGISGVPGARDAVLALAAGTLLGGVFAVTFLLAARFRHGIAAALAAIPPAAAAVLALNAPPAGLLPAAVAVLAATHLAGLLIVALTAADLRRTP